MSCDHNCIHERRARLANKLEINKDFHKTIEEAHKHHDHSETNYMCPATHKNAFVHDESDANVDDLVSFIEGKSSIGKQKAKKERKKQKLEEQRRLDDEAKRAAAKEQLRKLNVEKIGDESSNQLSKKKLKKLNQKAKQALDQNVQEEIENDLNVTYCASQGLYQVDKQNAPKSATELVPNSKNLQSPGLNKMQTLGTNDKMIEMEQLKLKHAQEMEILKLQHRQALEEEQMRQVHKLREAAHLGRNDLTNIISQTPSPFAPSIEQAIDDLVLTCKDIERASNKPSGMPEKNVKNTVNPTDSKVRQDIPNKKGKKKSKQKGVDNSSNKTEQHEQIANSHVNHNRFGSLDRGFLLDEESIGNLKNSIMNNRISAAKIQNDGNMSKNKPIAAKSQNASVSKNRQSTKNISGLGMMSQNDSPQLKDLKAHLNTISNMPATNRHVSSDSGISEMELQSGLGKSKNTTQSLEQLNAQLDQLNIANASKSITGNIVRKPLTPEEREKLKAEILSGKNNPANVMSSLDSINTKLSGLTSNALGMKTKYPNPANYEQKSMGNPLSNTVDPMASHGGLGSINSLTSALSGGSLGSLTSALSGSGLESLTSALGDDSLGNISSLLKGIDLSTLGQINRPDSISSMMSLNPNGTQKSKIRMQKITRRDGAIMYSCSRCHLRSEDAAEILSHKTEDFCNDLGQ